VHRPARVLPQLELLAVHPELAARNLADFLVDAAELEFTDWKAHGGAAIAAAPRLMEHERPMLLLQPLDDFPRRARDADAGSLLNADDCAAAQKSPNAFSL